MDEPPGRAARSNGGWRLLLALSLCVVLTLPSASRATASTPLHVDGLTVNREATPLGLGDPQPLLAWRLTGDDRARAQSAYRVLVASTLEQLQSEQADIWDSGVVHSSDSVNVQYGGSPLASRQHAVWKVQVWDEAGAVSAWSAPGRFELGLLAQDDWTATWIQPQPDYPEGGVVYLRTDFDTPALVSSARLHISALGLYEARLNGQRVGDAVLAPGWTDFDRRVEARTYDVSDLVRAGDNTVGVLLGGGWYVGPMKGGRHYRGRPAVIAQLELSLADGSTQRVRTDDTWQVGVGGLQYASIYYGELYDARAEQPGWDQPGFVPLRPWRTPEIRTETPPIEPARAPPVRVIQTLTPVSITPRGSGTWIVDLGQNFAGWVRLRARVPDGELLRLRFGELLNPDGSLYTDNLRGAGGDRWVGDGQERTYEPRFTYHGFRYVEISGLPSDALLGADALEGIVVSADLRATGTLATSSALVNNIQHLTVWGQRSTYLAVPTDTPQRAERLGWTGDVAAFASTAALNSDVTSYLATWLTSVRDGQRADGAVPDIAPWTGIDRFGSAGWGDAAAIVPWVLYERSGDSRVLADNYGLMTRWVNYLQASSPDLIRPRAGYGDWMSPPAMPGERSEPELGGDDAPAPRDLIGTAFFAHSADLTSQAARILGRSADAAAYGELRDRVRAAFAARFVLADGRLVSDSQSAYVLALAFGLVPDGLQSATIAHLVRTIEERNGHLDTGFVATPYLLTVLAEHGRADVAYRLLEQRTYPSWGFTVDLGATTPWERWDALRADGSIIDSSASFNHAALVGIGDFLYGTVGGLAPDPRAPGFRRVLVRPVPGGTLTSAEARLDTPYGLVRSGWSRSAAGGLRLELAVAVNTTAEVHVPLAAGQVVRESGLPVEHQPGVLSVRVTAGEAIIEVGSGSYVFETAAP